MLFLSAFFCLVCSASALGAFEYDGRILSFNREGSFLKVEPSPECFVQGNTSYYFANSTILLDGSFSFNEVKLSGSRDPFVRVTNGLMCDPLSLTCSRSSADFPIVSLAHTYSYFCPTVAKTRREIDLSKNDLDIIVRISLLDQVYTVTVTGTTIFDLFIRGPNYSSDHFNIETFVHSFRATLTLDDISLNFYGCRGMSEPDFGCTVKTVLLSGTGPCLNAATYMSMGYVSYLRCQGGWPYVLLITTITSVALVCFSYLAVFFFFIGRLMRSAWGFISWPCARRRRGGTRSGSAWKAAALGSAALLTCASASVVPHSTDPVFLPSGGHSSAEAFRAFDHVFGPSGSLSSTNMLIDASSGDLCENTNGAITCATYTSIRGAFPTTPGTCKVVQMTDGSDEGSLFPVVTFCSVAIEDVYRSEYSYYTSRFTYYEQCIRRCPGSSLDCVHGGEFMVGGCPDFTSEVADCPGMIYYDNPCGCIGCGCASCGSSKRCCKWVAVPYDGYLVSSIQDSYRRYTVLVRIDEPSATRAPDGSSLSGYRTVFTLNTFDENSPGEVPSMSFSGSRVGFDRQGANRIISEDSLAFAYSLTYEGSFVYTPWRLPQGFKLLFPISEDGSFLIEGSGPKCFAGSASDVNQGIFGAVGWIQSNTRYSSCLDVKYDPSFKTVSRHCPDHDTCNFNFPAETNIPAQYRSIQQVVGGIGAVAMSSDPIPVMRIKRTSGPSSLFRLTFPGGLNVVQYTSKPCPVAVFISGSGCFNCATANTVLFTLRSTCGEGVTTARIFNQDVSIVGASTFHCTTQLVEHQLNLVATAALTVVKITFSGTISQSYTWEYTATRYESVSNRTDATVITLEDHSSGGIGFGNLFSGLGSFWGDFISVLLYGILFAIMVYLAVVFGPVLFAKMKPSPKTQEKKA